jgi:hypothetical protein
MVIKINPARLALWRDAKTIQFGFGREAITLDNVQEAEERFINLLYRGIATDALETVSSSIGIRATEAEVLMKRLRPVLLDEAATEATTREAHLVEEFVRQAFAEIIRASFEHNSDGVGVLQHRAKQQVAITRLNKTTLVLALALASSGIGAVWCDDDSPIELADTGLLGFDRSLIGTPKNLALAALLESSVGPCKLLTSKDAATGGARFSVAVMCANHSLTMADFEADGQRRPAGTLAIELGVESSRVSPVMLAGSTPCLDCRNVSQSSADESWAALSSQLRLRKERLDDSQTSLLCAGFALEVLVRHLDARKPSAFEAKTIDHRTGFVSLESWAKLPECGC